MLWNSYPKFVRNSIIKRFQQKQTAVQKDDESVIKIWICLPYSSNKGEVLVKNCMRYFVLLKIGSLLIRNPMFFTQ